MRRGYGAYYAYDMTHEPPMPGTLTPADVPDLGAYYAYDMTTEPPMAAESLSGMAEDEALRAIGGQKPVAQVALWANRPTELFWQLYPSREIVTLYPLTDAIVKNSQEAAFGGELEYVGVLSAIPLLLSDAEAVFYGTPYEAKRVHAVYLTSDTRPIPQMLFLVTARRLDIDDSMRGRGSLEQAANRLAGELVLLDRTGQKSWRPLPPPEVAYRAIDRTRVPAPAMEVATAGIGSLATDHLKILPVFVAILAIAIWHGNRSEKKG